MGACEPEAVLNLGWFNSAASRAMLMHTRVFGKYNGPEEKMLVSDTFTEINLIDNYASTARVNFNVVDTQGKAVADARVDFMIYNYAEFCPVVTKYTDTDGHSFLTAGKGDMLVWASHNGFYGYSKASFGTDEEIDIVLDKINSNDGEVHVFDVYQLDIVPPVEQYSLPTVTEEQRLQNEARKDEEDAMRIAYMDTFMNNETALAFVKEHGLPQEAVSYLMKSSGNHEVIKNYLLQGGSVDYLALLSDKDLRDVSLEVLKDQQTVGSQPEMRVEDEMLVPYKRFFKESISLADQQRFSDNPAELVKWCTEHLHIVDGPYAQRVAMSSVGVWKSGVISQGWAMDRC